MIAEVLDDWISRSLRDMMGLGKVEGFVTGEHDSAIGIRMFSNVAAADLARFGDYEAAAKREPAAEET